MPDQGCDNSPAEHYESRDNADQSHFDATNVAGLLRIIAVQETPHERRQDDGYDTGTRHLLEERNRKQAEEKFFGGCCHHADRDTSDPRERSVHHIRVVQVLWRPYP